MDKPTVRAVHRVILDADSYGGLTARALDCPVQPFAQGAAIVLECGDGWWMRESELERILPALSRVGHISVTGRFIERRGASVGFGIICGLEAIAARLDQLLSNPPLFESA
ncbi:hypothetical protein ACIO8H_35830 [Streptomyces sp. NPDC087226]|jgi:hypothetical protein|uniref:hypothetical protein n=1 Tax=Streptomyces sp. NPDC087226 TaxID=3365771 RepID=UPI00381B0FF4